MFKNKVIFMEFWIVKSGNNLHLVETPYCDGNFHNLPCVMEACKVIEGN